jgi:hypothetical protein
MVSRQTARLATLLALLCLAGCELFTVSPFPGFVSRTDISIDLGSRINAITAGVSPVNYDLNVIDQPGLPPRVLLLVEPPSSDPTLGFNYKGKLIFMDEDLNVLGQASTASSLDYFSRPYSYGRDTTGYDVLAGYTVLDSSGNRLLTLTPTTLEGFAFTDGTYNYIFSTPAGQYASFDLNFAVYTSSPSWGISPTPNGTTLAIVPPAARPSTSDPNYANLGYQLVGLAYNSSTTEITFVFSEPAQGRIVAARLGLAAAISGTPPLGTGVLLPSVTSWPVAGSSWPLSVTVDRPELHADDNGFFMVQRDGWMTRCTWTPTGALAQVGSRIQIVGDRSLNRHYAFLLPQSGGPQYMYRFDPSSRILTRYKRWW